MSNIAIIKEVTVEDKNHSILPPPMLKQGNQWVYEGRYTNCNGYNIVIVASVSVYDSAAIQKVIDWAAYIGADTSAKEIYAIQYTLSHGNKLSESDAKYYFPFLADYTYRR